MPKILTTNVVDENGQLDVDLSNELKAAMVEQAKTVKSEVKPSYFSSDLTGSGKKTGLLNATNLPPQVMPPIPQQILNSNLNFKKQKITSGTFEYLSLPVGLIPFTYFNLDNFPTSAVDISSNPNNPIKIAVTAENIHIVRSLLQTANINDKRKLYVEYAIWLITENKVQNKIVVKKFNEYCLNPAMFQNMAIGIDMIKLTDYFKSLTNYDIINDTAMLWENLHEYLNYLSKEEPNYIPAVTSSFGLEYFIQDLITILNNYDITLSNFEKLYNLIIQYRDEGKITFEQADDLVNSNLNLLLNEKITTLKNIKDQLPCVKKINYSNPTNLSPEQLLGVTSEDSLNIMQAGAGTGKSTSLNGRLMYLVEAGEKLEDTLVLSFTNAAADHITEIAPGVESYTIASKINALYTTKYNHLLSSPNTLHNIIEATLFQMPNAFTDGNVARELSRGLKMLESRNNSNNDAMLTLSNVIKHNFDSVIQILDNLNQTTLELQSLICYYDPTLCIENKYKHIIMDEVQDTSIFEFIFIINYVINNKTSLFMVGDGAQTLYEFRASNPKALTALEMSGIFNCTKLETNYRSNQNILDLANIYLKDIDANYQNVQLQSNALQRDSFTNQVDFSYLRINKKSDIKPQLAAQIAKMKPWIDDKLAKGEQICFLAYARSDVTLFEEALATAYPQIEQKSLMPIKTISQAYFSKYIFLFGADYIHIKGNDATQEIMNHICGNMAYIVNKQEQSQIVENDLTKWIIKERNNLILLDQRLQIGTITSEEFKNAVFQTLINFEIDKNAMRQHLISKANMDKKAEDISNVPFLFCTIHSAKGLEFDNTVVLFDDEEATKKQASKRMYYVALTRAKKAEYIISYGKNVSNSIEVAYDIICNNLQIPNPHTKTYIVNKTIDE